MQHPSDYSFTFDLMVLLLAAYLYWVNLPFALINVIAFYKQKEPVETIHYSVLVMYIHMLKKELSKRVASLCCALKMKTERIGQTKAHLLLPRFHFCLFSHSSFFIKGPALERVTPSF